MPRFPSILITAVLLLPAAEFAAADATADFQALLDESWEFQMQEFPTFASYLGDRRYNDRWTDQSLDAIARRQAKNRDFLQRLYAIDRNALNDGDSINYELFRRELQSDVDRYRFKGYLMPFRHRGGVQTLNENTRGIPQETVKDYEDWLARIANIDVVINQTIERAERGRKDNIMSPAVLMQRVPDQIATQLVEVGTDSPFYEFFEDLPDGFSDADKERLQQNAIDVIEETVVPAYRRLALLFCPVRHFASPDPSPTDRRWLP